MTSEVQICNMGLAKIGEAKITNLTDDNRVARACNLIYEDIRDAVLRAHPWNFAMKRVELAQLTSTPAFGFAYEYQLPSDYLKVVQMDPQGQDIKYKIEGSKLLSDEGTVYILYISKVTDPTEYDSVFREILATRLGAELAFLINNDKDLKEMLLEEYMLKIGEGRSLDAQEDTADVIEESTWLTSRY